MTLGLQMTPWGLGIPLPEGQLWLLEVPPCAEEAGKRSDVCSCLGGTSTTRSHVPSPIWRVRHNWSDPLSPSSENPTGHKYIFLFSHYSQCKTKGLFEKMNNSITRLAFFVAAATKFTWPDKHIAAVFKLSLTSAWLSPKSSTSKDSVSWLNDILLWVTMSLTRFYLKLMTDPEAASISHSGSPQT